MIEGIIKLLLVLLLGPYIPTFFMTLKHNSIGIADLGVVHNCQNVLNSTENTNY